jgi:hypothetical protein
MTVNICLLIARVFGTGLNVVLNCQSGFKPNSEKKKHFLSTNAHIFALFIAHLLYMYSYLYNNKKFSFKIQTNLFTNKVLSNFRESRKFFPQIIFHFSEKFAVTIS